jgi:hypothetical protein
MKSILGAVALGGALPALLWSKERGPPPGLRFGGRGGVCVEGEMKSIWVPLHWGDGLCFGERGSVCVEGEMQSIWHRGVYCGRAFWRAGCRACVDVAMVGDSWLKTTSAAHNTNLANLARSTIHISVAHELTAKSKFDRTRDSFLPTCPRYKVAPLLRHSLRQRFPARTDIPCTPWRAGKSRVE